VKTALLDINVLAALLWPAHEHHDAAHRWFTARADGRWATCPLTQFGFVRILSNPSFSSDAPSPMDAVALLAENVEHPRHEFWAEETRVADAVGPFGTKLQGYRQFTDAYLLAVAQRRRGVVATFDRGMRSLAGETFSTALELVPTR
jgi:toxin-antitoxin system PIN domain toxin